MHRVGDMKAMAIAAVLGLGFLTGCTVAKRPVIVSPTPPHRSEYSTGERLRLGEDAIEARAESLERQGFTSKEARQYAEIEYLKSRTGSPVR